MCKCQILHFTYTMHLIVYILNTLNCATCDAVGYGGGGEVTKSDGGW